MRGARPHRVGGLHRHGAMFGLRHAHGAWPPLVLVLVVVVVVVLVVRARR